MSNPEYVVKITRETYESVVFMGSKEECQAAADKLNSEYQTDEYYLEKFEKERFFTL